MPKFSRNTVIELIKSMGRLTMAEVNRLLMRYGLEDECVRSTNPHTLNALAKYLIDNPDAVGPLGSNMVFELITEEIRHRHAIVASRWSYPEKNLDDEIPGLMNSLRGRLEILFRGSLERL